MSEKEENIEFLVPVEPFKQTLKLMQVAREDMAMTLVVEKQDGIATRATLKTTHTDPTNVLMVGAEIDVSVNTDEPVKFAFDMRMLDFIKNLKDEELSLILEKENDKFSKIVIESGNMKFVTKPIDPPRTVNEFDAEKHGLKEYPVQAKELKRALDLALKISDNATFIVDGSLRLASNNDIEAVEVTLDESASGEARANYNAEILSQLLKALPSDYLLLKLATDKPLGIEHRGDDYRIFAYLAPRVEE